MERKRVEWIDISRGISIIMVIILHSCTSAIRDYDFGAFLAYSFTVTSAVSVVFFLAGCSMALQRNKYSEMNFFTFLKKKVVSLLVPYSAYSVLIYVIFQVMNRVPGIDELMNKAGYGPMSFKTFIKGLLIGNNELSIHVWFLYVLFIYEMVAFCFFKYFRKEIFLMGLTIFVTLVAIFCEIPMSQAWNGGINSFFYFVMGIFLVKRNFKKASMIIAIFLWGILFYGYVEWVIYTGQIHFPLVGLISVMAIIVISTISKLMKGKLANGLKWIGKNSMTLYLLQQPFFGSALGTILFAALGMPAYLSVIVCIFASFAGPFFIRTIFIRHKWFSVLFGIN